MKKTAAIILALAMLLALGACASTPQKPEETPAPTESPVTTEEPLPELDRAQMLAAYAAALQETIRTGITPDGFDHGQDLAASMSMSNNRFAVVDIDADGREELIIQFNSSPVAGQTESIFSYDETTGLLVSKLTEFPLLTYYSNGYIQAGWSHNQGYAGDALWPFDLYRFESETRSYISIASVDAWNRAYSEGSSENPFPADADADGDGIVYLITESGSTRTVDRAEYETWLSSFIDASNRLDINYLTLTEENVAALGAPAGETPTENTVKVTLSLPNDNADGFDLQEVSIAALEAQDIIDALISAGALPEGVKVNSMSFSSDGFKKTVLLDLNDAFSQSLQNTGTAGEFMRMYCVVNSFLDIFDADNAVITVNGAVIETGHSIYDQPLERYAY